jgi:hypothetical protein
MASCKEVTKESYCYPGPVLGEQPKKKAASYLVHGVQHSKLDLRLTDKEIQIAFRMEEMEYNKANNLKIRPPLGIPIRPVTLMLTKMLDRAWYAYCPELGLISLDPTYLSSKFKNAVPGAIFRADLQISRHQNLFETVNCRFKIHSIPPMTFDYHKNYFQLRILTEAVGLINDFDNLPVTLTTEDGKLVYIPKFLTETLLDRSPFLKWRCWYTEYYPQREPPLEDDPSQEPLLRYTAVYLFNVERRYRLVLDCYGLPKESYRTIGEPRIKRKYFYDSSEIPSPYPYNVDDVRKTLGLPPLNTEYTFLENKTLIESIPKFSANRRELWRPPPPSSNLSFVPKLVGGRDSKEPRVPMPIIMRECTDCTEALDLNTKCPHKCRNCQANSLSRSLCILKRDENSSQMVNQKFCSNCGQRSHPTPHCPHECRLCHNDRPYTGSCPQMIQNQKYGDQRRLARAPPINSLSRQRELIEIESRSKETQMSQGNKLSGIIDGLLSDQFKLANILERIGITLQNASQDIRNLKDTVVPKESGIFFKVDE